jgi:hypothetical protein
MRTVEVNESDLNLLHATLTTAYNYLLSRDLQRQYQDLDNGVRESPLTSAVKGRRERVAGYLNELNKPEEIPDE